MDLFNLPLSLAPMKTAPAKPHVRIESDLVSPLLKAQQGEKAQARFAFDADNLPLFGGRPCA